jgi:hypothetical protein
MKFKMNSACFCEKRIGLDELSFHDLQSGVMTQKAIAEAMADRTKCTRVKGCRRKMEFPAQSAKAESSEKLNTVIFENLKIADIEPVFALKKQSLDRALVVTVQKERRGGEATNHSSRRNALVLRGRREAERY